MREHPLPIDEILPALLTSLGASRAAVVKAPPGAGKTTRIPLALLGSGLLGQGKLVLVQPRRMAVRAIARVLSRLLGEETGETVGYKVRFDERASAGTRILVVTEGILMRMLASDPLLEGVAVVVLDEFHERTVDLDLGLALVKESLDARPDLRLVVMSATIDTRPLSAYLGACPVLECEGRAHPLAVEHARAKDDRPLHVRTTAAILSLLKAGEDDGGDVLVFLPGAQEIRRLAEHLAGKRLPGDPEILPLYGSMAAAEQDRALWPGDRRRLVLATNIAESSLTIPNVTAVVDTGLVKVLRSDPRLGLDRLETVPASRDSADQRAGRAGRTAPGRVIRLWSAAEHRSRPEAAVPEIRRIDLAPHALRLVACRPGDPRVFPYFEPPPKAALEAALETLVLLGALEPDAGRATEHGKRLAALPLPPRLGTVVLAAAGQGLLERGALLAALLDERDIVAPVAGGPQQAVPTVQCDVVHRLELFEEHERRGATRPTAQALGLDPARAAEVGRVRDQLVGIARAFAPFGAARRSRAESEPALRRLLLAGFPDRVCRRQAAGSAEAVMVGGFGVRLGASSGVREGELFIALAAESQDRGDRAWGSVSLASRVDQEDLEAVYPSWLTERREVLFDERDEAVRCAVSSCFRDLVIGSRPGLDMDPEAAAPVLADAARRNAARFIRLSEEAARLRDRIAFAARVLPESHWPDVGDGALVERLAALCVGRRSFADLERIDWAAELGSSLGFERARLLDREIPDRIEVPSGSRIRIDYGPAAALRTPPVLAVKLQELFGLSETPRIAKGRVALLLHLLAPNGRPVQITTDIESFWSGAYHDVRKILRSRYPKHHWPEDPRTARPEARAKPRGRA